MADEPDELEKIAQLAVRRGYWDARAALEGVAMARLHTTGPQKVFLKKLLERKVGLTYDELARLEKDALAPPVTQTTPAKPLPRLGSAKPASAVQESLASAEVVIPRVEEKKAPPPQQTAETYVAPPREEQIISSTKKLPSLGADAKKESPISQGSEIVTPRPLPRLNAPRKKPEEPPAS